MNRFWLLALLILSGCAAAGVAPLPTPAHLPTAAPFTTMPLPAYPSPSASTPIQPILLPTPYGANPSIVPASAEPSSPEPTPLTTLSRGLEGAPPLMPDAVVAALPTRALRPISATALSPTLAPLPFVFPSPTPFIVAAAPTAQPVEAAALPPLDAAELALFGVPLLWQFDTPQVRAIIERGRALGNNPRGFTTVGDSNSLSGDFLRPLILENYCAWGSYGYLQQTVDYFNTPPLSGGESAFTHQSAAVQMGFNSAAALDPLWATDARCESGETPLTCELRTTRPAAVILMLGGRDVIAMSQTAYRENINRILDETLARGVIPVLTTFVVLPGRDAYDSSLAFNETLVDLAGERGTPLIHLWAAARPLPDSGIASDGSHLRTQPGRFCDFDGGERRYGGTLRNLLTLQALDLLRLALSS
ncbi:MAG: hypothetical protein L6Q98_16280 [Anaerolineae bacterium]|nr:hypothetical protein [Anaerolineae bacterium]NUQ04236.1 hypothetical protein [Anaerolineae bacterium]